MGKKGGGFAAPFFTPNPYGASVFSNECEKSTRYHVMFSSAFFFAVKY
jgi:hypothetical protein